MSVIRRPARWSLTALVLLLLAAGNRGALSQGASAGSGGTPATSGGASTTSGGASAQPCVASPTWFTSPSLRFLDTDLPATPFCGFYQYAWEAFIYLTRPAPGKHGALNFETFASVDDLASGATALIPGATIFVDKRQNRTRVLRVRGIKPFAEQQAQTIDVLADQHGNPTYYEQFLSPIAFDFIKSCSVNLCACVPLPLSAQTTSSQNACSTLATVAAAVTPATTASAAASTAASKLASTTPPTWVNNLFFPAGAIEIKVSWRVLAKNTPKGTYYTLNHVTLSKGTPPVDLGLVGFHLVYATPGHPEMVWATFEHVDNAPSGPCPTASTGSSTAGSITATPPAGFKGWAFNSATRTSPTINCTSSAVNQPSTQTTPPLPHTQALRNNPYGSDPSSTGGKLNIETIEQLNSSVSKRLKGSVWRHYFLVGAVWTGGGLPAVPPPLPSSDNANQLEIGSTLLANATMETFTQSPYTTCGKNQTLCVNCFSCHNTNVHPPPFGISHAVGGNPDSSCPTTQSAACLSTQQIPAAHGSKP